MNRSASIGEEFSGLSISQLEAVLDALPIPVSWASLSFGYIMFMNSKFTQTYGYTTQDFKTVAEWIEGAYPTEEQRQSTTADWMRYIGFSPDKAYEIPSREVAIICKDGTIKIAEHSGVILPDIGLALATFVDITERKSEENKIKALAETCPLTGLLNRRAFDAHLEHALWIANRSSSSIALLLVDLDNFKSVNDGYGHQTGDLVLIEAANRLQHAVRSSDHVARIGGDEFAIILIHANEQDAGHICEKILAAMALPTETSHGPLACGCSIGLAHFPQHGADAGDLFSSADQALYVSKRSGRGRWTSASEIMPTEGPPMASLPAC